MESAEHLHNHLIWVVANYAKMVDYKTTREWSKAEQSIIDEVMSNIDDFIN